MARRRSVEETRTHECCVSNPPPLPTRTEGKKGILLMRCAQVSSVLRCVFRVAAWGGGAV
jgi:hypothetical protein